MERERPRDPSALAGIPPFLKTTANSYIRAMERFKRVLSVAGSDSGGGAGIQADLKTIAACGCYGMTAITAVTVQNTQGVRGVHAVPADVVAGQIDAVLEDIGVDAVKLGMLPSEAIIVETARLIRKYGVRHVVMDPVMIATSGDRLSPSRPSRRYCAIFSRWRLS